MSGNRVLRATLTSGASLFAVAGVLQGLPTQAFAQEAAQAGAAPPAGESGTLEQIVVTGSRITSGFTTPTPVTVAAAAQLEEAAPRSLADGLMQLPAFNGSLANQTVVTAATGGTNGQSLLNLRNLGPNRTLVLLDGRRMVASNSLGSVDIETLPQNLVQRVDVVTGGASAAYGSDAVAGVVNFILDTKFEGVKGQLKYGVSSRNDLPGVGASLAVGHSWLDRRARLIASAEYFRQSGVNAAKETGRDWFDRAAGKIPNPLVGATPSRIIVPDIRSSLGTYGGLISSGPLKGTQFLPGGASAPFNYGSFTGSTWQSGGDGARANIAFAPDQLRENVFLHGEYDVNEHLTLFGEAAWARSHPITGNTVNPRTGTNGQFTIFRDNPYLPRDILARMVAANVQSIPLGRYMRDFPIVRIETMTEVKRFSAGGMGALFGSWKWDASYSYGRTYQRVSQQNLPINRNIYAAVDAVVNPATGQIVCRSTLAGLDPGCVPLNLFGEGAPSAAAIGYTLGASEKYLTLKQHVAVLNFSGDLGDKLTLGAGPISLATGIEYRKEIADQSVDPISPMITDFTGIRGAPASQQGRPGGFQFFNPLPLAGSYDVKEGYAEVGVPVFADRSFARSLDLNGAVRHAIYSQSGGVTTWKAGFNYEVVDGLRLRLTRSRDIRGPNILELFNSATQNSSNNVYKGVTVPSLLISSGNPDLKPEKADTLTYGVVLRPSFLPGLQASVDYYKINIHDAVGTLGSQRVLDQCADGNTLACDQFTVTPAGTLIIRNQNLNLDIEKTAGYDFEVAYSHPLWGGQGSLRLLGNHATVAYSQAPGLPIVQELSSPTQPKWRASLQARYNTDKWSLFLQERYIGPVKVDPTEVEGVDVSDNHVGSVMYTDLGVTYRLNLLGHEQELYFTVTNLLDKGAPVAPANPTSYSQPSNPAYDYFGRYYSLGLRFRLQ